MDYELLLPLQRLRQMQWLPISPSWELPIALPQLGPSLAIVGVLPSLLLHFTWFCQSSAQTLNNSMFPSFSNRLDEAPVTNCNKFGYMARACIFAPGYDMGAKYLSTNDLCVYQIHNKLHLTTNNSLHRKFDISVYDGLIYIMILWVDCYEWESVLQWLTQRSFTWHMLSQAPLKESWFPSQGPSHAEVMREKLYTPGWAFCSSLPWLACCGLCELSHRPVGYWEWPHCRRHSPQDGSLNRGSDDSGGGLRSCGVYFCRIMLFQPHWWLGQYVQSPVPTPTTCILDRCQFGKNTKVPFKIHQLMVFSDDSSRIIYCTILKLSSLCPFKVSGGPMTSTLSENV